MIASKLHLPSWWPSSTPGMSNGIAPSRSAISATLSAATNRNSASGSTNFLISQGHATRSTFTCSRVIHFIAYLLAGSLLFDAKVVKVSHRVGLGPQSDLAGVFESVIRRVDLLFAVIEASDVITHAFDAQLVPFTGRDLEVSAGKLNSPPVDYVIEPIVVLESVRAHDVVVVRVLKPECQARRSIDLARNRFEFDAQFKVLEGAFVGDRKRKPVIGLVGRSLCKDVGLGRRRRIRLHNPVYRSSLAGEGFVKPGRRLARRGAVEVVCEFLARGLKRRGIFW